MNNFFISAPQTIVQNIPYVDVNDISPKYNPYSIFILPYTENKIVTLFSQIQNKQSLDMDGLSSKFIKEYAEELSKPLCYLINLSIEMGFFPDRLKITKIIPIHKKNDTQKSENYRPISISSIFAKIFEYGILNRITSFIDKFKLIPDEQHGFRKMKSTSTAINEFYMNIMSELDKKRYPIGIFCDLSRAFDCVPHVRLLDKLETMGFRGPIVR